MLILAVKDANILIDCLQINLLEAVFRLPVTFITTDFILAEIMEEEQLLVLQDAIKRKELKVASFTYEQIIEIQSLADNNAGISLEDASGLYLAEQEAAMLLTGDGKLRKLCQQRKVEVHGIIWLLDQLVAEGIIEATLACQKIKLLQTLNPRLPQRTIQERVGRWCLYC